MTQDHVFPEDEGTGASQGDSADAANFGALAQHELLSDYKASGLSIQNVDYQSLTFDITAGKAFVKDASAVTAQSGDTRDQGVVYEVEVAPRTAVDLTDDATHEVFVDVDLTTGDSVSVVVVPDGTTPSAPFLKIAEIDTDTETVDESYGDSLDLDSLDLSDGNDVVWDSSEEYVPASSIEQGASSGLDADTVDGVEATELGSDVSNNGTTVTSSSTDLDFGENLVAADDGDGTSSISLDLTRFVGEDELPAGETLQIDSDEYMVVGGSYTLNGDAQIDGDLVTVANTEPHSGLSGVTPTDHLEVITEYEITAQTGSTPAFDGTLLNTFTEETTAFDVTVAPTSGLNDTYAFNFDDGKRYNNGSWDVPLTVNWDEDPGTDLDLTVRIHKRT